MSSPYEIIATVPTFTLTSTDLADGEKLALPQVSRGLGGEDLSPQLSWSGFPAETKSFAITIFDPDAPTASGYWHWSVADVPVTTTKLATGAGDEAGSGLPSGSIQLRTDAGVNHFVGAAPPSGHGKHRYVIAVHAVDIETLGLNHTAPPAVLGFHLHFHTLARAELTGWYELE